MQHQHAQHGTASGHHHHQWNPWILGGIAIVGGITLAPYLLPLAGAGSITTAHSIMSFVAQSTTNPLGSGLAGFSQALIGGIPLIGKALTSDALVTIPWLGVSIGSGALLSIVLTTAIGVGGTLLANWMEKHEQPGAALRWSKVVRYTALITSALLAMPGILSGLSVGLTFIAGLFGQGSQVALSMQRTLGVTKMFGGASSGIAAILPHLLACGLPFIPVAAAMFLDSRQQTAQPAALADATVTCVNTPALRSGVPMQLTFRLSDAAGRPIGPEQLATTHTQKLHTMVLDQSLTDYHHLHPQYDPASGLYTAEFTPRLNARYSAWHDFTLQGASEPSIRRTALPTAPGTPQLSPRLLPSSHAEAEGLCIDVRSGDPLAAGEPGMLTIRVTDPQGRPVNNLEPIMGAYGHLAGFSDNGAQCIHSHPITELGTPLHDGMLQFHVIPNQPGMVKFFLQLKQDGQEVTLPFVQPVRQKELAAERYLASQQAMTPRLSPAL